MSIYKALILKKCGDFIKKALIFIFTFIIICILLLILCYNRFVLPSAIAVSQKYAVSRINSEISRAVDISTARLGISTEDIMLSDGEDRMSINSLLINKLCSQTASELSNGLSLLRNEKIELPVGLFSGIGILSNAGMNIPVYLQSVGEASADYDTEMKSGGINQVSYMVWLNVECRIEIVNPLWKKEVVVKRKIMLADTIFNGKVPEGYIYGRPASTVQASS